MTVIAVTASKGSPGATSTAAALAASAVDRGEPALVVELDTDGGTTAIDAQLSLDPGLLTLAAAARRGLDPSLVEAHSQQLANGTRVLLAPTSPARVRTAVASLAERLVDPLSTLDGVVIVDCGRWGDDSALPVLAAADVVLLVLRPTVLGTEHARTRLAELARHGIAPAPVCVGEVPYPPGEVAAALRAPAARVLPDDQRTAELMRAGVPLDRWLRRTPLMRAARRLVDDLIGEDGVEEVSA